MAIGSSISQPLIEHAGIQYRLGRCIGQGRYGVAFKADVVSQTRVVALKIKLKSLESQGDGEAWVHAEVHHPNIVDLYHAFSDPHHHYLVMEYCENGSLADLLQRRGSLTLFEVRAMFIQISGAAAYMHGKGIFHRDLIAENVLFDADGNVKIADFGLAEMIDPSRGSTHRRVTLAYAAPEVIAKGGIGCHPSSDTWSIGVLL
jgi:serine/threonine protein kinase